MTQQEFFNRTGVMVDENEFWSINENYCYSELDKDEYCKLWMKMNPTRVAKAKEGRALKEKKNALLSKIFSLGLSQLEFRKGYYDTPSHEFFNDKQKAFIEGLGIKISNHYNGVTYWPGDVKRAINACVSAM